jgi:hypothetical protein
VRTQIAVALIAFLLLRLAQATQKAIASPLAFARLVRIDLMQRRRLDPPPLQRPDADAIPRSTGYPMPPQLNRTAPGQARG